MRINRALAFLVSLLFVAVIVTGAFGTSWHTVPDLPENPADPSNIEGIGMLIFTQFVAPFEVLSIVLLASLIGAIYIAKGEGNK
ncbi:NADH:ubiquinone oxidoreductase subunit J [Methanosarcina horonobensis HB-1 = JCM 15518]|uniref:NADH:ubiquinone oxidoreductase subunit J n=1 Tax=Methanosarcina horonobensis HB-1 = JCM 15518 TaxID=1434110 RepID=A0A0E3SEF9_9EURY|nr:F420H2 dehydrogenase subunit FpoJ [Methanosarcina horonobensis]AKB79311.1 NADH:ubiquinone oxidoreductase subunit J [Methanosarcina horonobensis HB-1 = JCM 15518]